MLTFRFTPQVCNKKLGWKSHESKVLPKEYSVMTNISIIDGGNRDNNCSGNV